jgi:hypothetical protein
MEELSNFISRYYVIKIEGIFSKHSRFLHINENSIEFKPIPYGKTSKTRDIIFYKEIHTVMPVTSNDKDLIIKSGRQSFTLTSSSRLNLLVDLLLYKDLWDLANTVQLAPGIKRFEAYKEMEFNNPSSYIPIRVTLMRSTLLVESTKEHEESKSMGRYLIKYNDIQSIIMLSYAITIHTKVFLYVQV